jgi:aminoglycoside phosphotransferase family enzyme
LGDRPAVIDCLEFNREFRLLDMASDFSFLTVECDRLGGGPVSRWFWDTYTSVTGDHPDRQLKAFYRSMQALTRARIAIWHLEEPGEAGPAKWRSKAQQYLELAAAFVRWK